MNKMRKFLPYILMLVIMLSAFLSPVSLNFQKNEAQAYIYHCQAIPPFDDNFKASTLDWNHSNTTAGYFHIKIDTGFQTDDDCIMLSYDRTNYFVPAAWLVGAYLSKKNPIILAVFDDQNNFVTSIDLFPTIANSPDSILRSSGSYTDTFDDQPFHSLPAATDFDDEAIPGLTAGKNYTAKLYYRSSIAGNGGGENLLGSTSKDYYPIAKTSVVFQTAPAGSTADIGPNTSNLGTGGNVTTTPGTNEDILPACGMIPGTKGTFYGCIIQGFYYVFWVPSSWLAGLAGNILDFFLFYTISSSSYQSGFVASGWGVVRDVSNIIFIFALLFVAIKTILSLGGGLDKKIIMWIIMAALFINFSLFFTRVLVDAGNILGGIFYHSVSADQVNGQAPKPGDENKEKTISAALVSKFDPQKIAGKNKQTAEAFRVNPALRTPFLIITILSTIVNVIMIFVFISVAFLFVARTLGLMLAMIFSPLAFASLAMGGAASYLEELGWSKWFENLIRLTFLAPIFLFFLWLILMFLDTDLIKGYIASSASNGLTTSGRVLFAEYMIVLLPFILIMGLLIKAKEVAVKFSGTLGAQLNKFAAGAAGIVGGAALGGVGMLGRATIGRAGSYLASSGGGVGPGPTGAGPGPTFVRPPTAYTGPTRFGGPTTVPPTPPTPPVRALLGPAAEETFARPQIGTAPVSPAGLLPTAEQRAATEKTEAEKAKETEKKAEDIKSSKNDIAIQKNMLTSLENTQRAKIANGDTEGAKITQKRIDTVKEAIKLDEARTGGTVNAGLVTVPAAAVAKPATTEPVKPPEAPKEEKKETTGPTLASSGAFTGFTRAEKIITGIPPTPPPPGRGMSLKDRAAKAPESIFGMKSMEDVKNMAGKKAFDLASYLGSVSFDPRELGNTKIGKALGKHIGIDFGKAGGKGGFDKEQADIIKKKLAYAEKLETSGPEYEKLIRAEKEATDKWQPEVDMHKGNFDKYSAETNKSLTKQENLVRKAREMEMKGNKFAAAAAYEAANGLNEEIETSQKNSKESKKFMEEAEEKIKKVKKVRENINNSRREHFADITEKGTFFGYSNTKQSASRQIRAKTPSKSDSDKLSEMVKKMIKDEEAAKPKEPKK